MNSNNPDQEVFTEARRKSISSSLRTISVDELKALGERLFPIASDPWREKYFNFISENATETFHHATTHDHFDVVYCHARNKGIWYLRDVGKGGIPADGLALLKEIVEKR